MLNHLWIHPKTTSQREIRVSQQPILIQKFYAQPSDACGSRMQGLGPKTFQDLSRMTSIKRGQGQRRNFRLTIRTMFYKNSNVQYHLRSNRYRFEHRHVFRLQQGPVPEPPRHPPRWPCLPHSSHHHPILLPRLWFRALADQPPTSRPCHPLSITPVTLMHCLLKTPWSCCQM